MARTYSKRNYVSSKDLPASGELEVPINLQSDTCLNVMVKAKYQATHGTTSGLQIEGKYGVEDMDGNIIWDTTSSPVDFGDVNVELGASGETLGTVQFAVPINDAPQHLLLKITNKDASNASVIDVFGCA